MRGEGCEERKPVPALGKPVDPVEEKLRRATSNLARFEADAIKATVAEE